MAQIITKVEWEKNISQIQLGARQSSGQSIYSFMAQELPKEAQKAYQNKESYMPDMYKSPSIMQFEMMGQNIGINGNDVQKTTRESLQSFPSSVLGLHAQKIRGWPR